jgi:carbon monoxide dehydrogenase subunit G
MHLAGETEIAATRDRVWDYISNPQRVAQSSPQSQAQVEKIDDTHYRLTVAVQAPMPTSVILNLELTEVASPNRIAARVGGTVMGGAIDGTGSIDLAELQPKLTRARWAADATLGGMLGMFEGMIQGPLQQAAEQGFAGLKERLEAEEAAAAGDSPAG